MNKNISILKLLLMHNKINFNYNKRKLIKLMMMIMMINFKFLKKIFISLNNKIFVLKKFLRKYKNKNPSFQ